MKTPETGKDTNVPTKNDSSLILRRAAKAALDGYSDHLSAGGKGDPAEESWIDALFDGAEAIVEMDNLKSRLAQAERERDAAVHDMENYAGYGAICKHFDNDCPHIVEGCPLWPSDCESYEWRGICPENTKEEPK